MPPVYPASQELLCGTRQRHGYQPQLHNADMADAIGIPVPNKPDMLQVVTVDDAVADCKPSSIETLTLTLNRLSP